MYPNGFRPAKDLFYSLSNSLADRVALPMRRAAIDSGAFFALCHVSSGLQFAQGFHTGSSILTFVHAHGDPMAARDGVNHFHGCLGLCGTSADAQAMVHDQPVAVLH